MSNFFIPKPCHENWNKMTPAQQGRHCEVCSKVVVDFTKKTKPEIKHIMQNAQGSVCGNFNMEQLDQKAQMKVFIKPSNLFNKNFKYLALAVFGIFAIKKAESQKLKGKVALRGDVLPSDYFDAYYQASTISGTVSATHTKTLGGAIITVYSNQKQIGQSKSLANGTYSIKIEPGKIISRKITITVSHFDYESKTVTDLSITKEHTRLNVVLDEEMMLMGIVMPVPQDTATVKPVIQTDTVKLNDEAGIIEPSKPIICENTYPAQNMIEDEDPDTEKEVVLPGNNFVVRPEDITATLFPNPVTHTATIYCNKTDVYKVELYDEKGSMLQTIHFSGAKTTVDVSAFEKGSYIVKINGTQGNSNTLKLIKQ